MPIDLARVRQYLKNFDFKTLFVEEMGWDRHRMQPLNIEVDGSTYTLNALVEKRGLVTFLCDPDPDGRIPSYAARRKIEKQAAKSVHEHLIIYCDAAKTTQTWQWVKREPAKPIACREHTYHRGQTGEPLAQKLQAIAFDLEEEETLTIFDVADRVRQGFYAERVTKRFYERFQEEHDVFLSFIKGIPDTELQRWYASVMLNRLMFIYFIQKKGFLGGDQNYLRNKLTESRLRARDRFYQEFIWPLFFEGFAKKAEDRSPVINRLLGQVPYLNGGIFLKHEIEIRQEREGRETRTPDTAFEKIFAFFDSYNWHLDERPVRADNEINPDVLGYIFEKYINQKQMGAYYTKEDITEYISKSTIIPFLFDAAEKKCAIAFKGDSALWRLLRDDPDRYIYDAVRQGVDLELPEEIAAGINDVRKRGDWNKPAAGEFALPAETWREHVARRRRCKEVRCKLAAGEIHSINDLVTYNLDLRQFAQDAIENCEGPELLRAFYHAIEKVTVLDPTCGSGAFLFAALNVLEPLYDACLDRMAVFVEEMERSGVNHHPKQFSDFKQILARVQEHPNHRYFILKSIIINNLYGVDIMHEAVEICKLRLFLKLVAQVDSAEKIEPLPDIDFNIRAGNTLVGFATYEEVKKAVTRKLDFDNVMGRIDENAEICDRAFQRFREMQTEHGMNAREFADAKVKLKGRLGALAEELDRYLAGEYGINQNIFPKKKEYEQRLENWRASHQPFHWFSEFYGIIKSGGFDVIIGNPPYLNLKDLNEYVVTCFVTLPARNLFPLILERCQKLIDKFGHQGYIVPVASISTEGYISLQNILIQKKLTFSSYDDRPSHLFDGLDKNTLSILLLSEKKNKGVNEVYSTRLSRWNAEERDLLFPLLEYNSGSEQTLNGCIPKIGNHIEASIWNKLFIKSVKLSSFYSTSQSHVVFYSRKVNAFLQILDFIPEVHDGEGNARLPSEFKTIYFATKGEALSVYCLFNSTLFRWFMDVVSDGSHLNRREIDNFPFNPQCAINKFPQLTSIANNLSRNLKSTSEIRVMRYKHDTLTIQCIIPKFSKSILNQIDNVLAQYYGFNDEELDFIINYDFKYRMGIESEDIE
ncbi:MAG: Eco57I restriction-modification methylase domain-containing protein [Desulfobaccales bacterium]